MRNALSKLHLQKMNLVAPSRRDEELEVGDKDRWLQTGVKGYRSIGIAVMGEVA